MSEFFEHLHFSFLVCCHGGQHRCSHIHPLIVRTSFAPHWSPNILNTHGEIMQAYISRLTYYAPWIVRTSFTLMNAILLQWALSNQHLFASPLLPIDLVSVAELWPIYLYIYTNMQCAEYRDCLRILLLGFRDCSHWPISSSLNKNCTLMFCSMN